MVHWLFIFKCSNLATCRFQALKFNDLQILCAQNQHPLYLYTRSKASLQIERPPSFVRLNFGDRWILSAQNRRLAVFVRGRDTYSTGQDSNLRSQRESDFESDALTSRPRLLPQRLWNREITKPPTFAEKSLNSHFCLRVDRSTQPAWPNG